MPKIKCTWIAYKHNTNKCGIGADSFGECTCQEEIVLEDAPSCGECDCETDGLYCGNFEFKPQFIK